MARVLHDRKMHLLHYRNLDREICVYNGDPNQKWFVIFMMSLPVNFHRALCLLLAIVFLFFNNEWLALISFVLCFFNLFKSYKRIDENGMYLEHCFRWKRLWKSLPEELRHQTP